MAVTKFVLIVAVSVLMLAGCARMAPPPGGPEDKVPPEIARSAPATDEVNVARDTDVVLEFSEPVNRATVEASLYLSPEPGRRLRYRWSGKRLTLDYLEPLPENRTIVVTVGSQARDMQGNALEASQTLAFSTGDHIDRGKVNGVAQMPPEARTLAITAYLLGDSVPDPMTDAPDYRMQTAPDGSFELSYLAPGRYRLFALDDRNFDGLWSPASEWIGSATQDAQVAEVLEPRVSFAPTLQDTTPPAIVRARHADAHSVDIRINRDLVPARFDLVDSIGRQSALYFMPDTSASGSWRVFSERDLSGDSAAVFAELDNLQLHTRFAVHARPDTSRPALFESHPANLSVLRTSPAELLLIFNEPIVYHPVDSLKITLREDSTDFAFTIEQTDPASLTLTPASPFRAGPKYKFQLPQQFVTDRAGNALRDSLMYLMWTTWPQDSLGNVSGAIRTSESGPWLVELYEVKDMQLLESFFTTSPFAFAGYPQGDYLLRVVRDVNGNQRFDVGIVNPLEFSEPFEWHPDTISIRPRWTAEVDFLWTTVTQP